MNTSYSFETSLPAYLENKEGKTIQKQRLYALIAQFGETSLKQLERATGIAQSTISPRIGELIEELKIEYSGFINFEGRKRKRIIPKIAGTGQLTINI